MGVLETSPYLCHLVPRPARSAKYYWPMPFYGALRDAKPMGSYSVAVSVEDEFGLANLILWPAVYQRYRQVLRQSLVIVAEGVVQHEKGALHLIVDKVAAVHLGADGAGSAGT